MVQAPDPTGADHDPLQAGQEGGRSLYAVRPGQEIRYRFTAGSNTFQVIQYSLFCRWHKRTYTVMSFAMLDIYPDWEPVFEKINSSFRILDAPKIQERLKKEEERRKKKEDAEKRRKALEAAKKATDKPADKPSKDGD